MQSKKGLVLHINKPPVDVFDPTPTILAPFQIGNCEFTFRL